MTHIKIERVLDSSDCECCGSNFSDGYRVTVDGKPFGDYEPIAHCYDSCQYDIEKVYKDLLIEFGHIIEESVKND